MFVTAVERALIKRACRMADARFLPMFRATSSVPPAPDRAHRHRHLPRDGVAHGSSRILYFGTGNDYSSKVARAAKHLIVEVNDRCRGSMARWRNCMSRGRGHRREQRPLLELPVPESGTGGRTIGGIIAEMVSDGACLQMGVGALPDLVCSQLAAGRIWASTQRRSAPG